MRERGWNENANQLAVGAHLTAPVAARVLAGDGEDLHRAHEAHRSARLGGRLHHDGNAARALIAAMGRAMHATEPPPPPRVWLIDNEPPRSTDPAVAFLEDVDNEGGWADFPE